MFPPGTPRGVYHVHSGVVEHREHFLGPQCEQILRIMRKHEKFCQVQVLAFSFMSDHFHILVAIDAPPTVPWDDERLLLHLQESGHARFTATQRALTALRQSRRDWEADLLRDSFLKRMWNLSFFMKGFKQEVTQWFNREYGRQGTLWAGRFKSAMIESQGDMLTLIASHIEFNAVRNGLVHAPQNYPWCSVAQAVDGSPDALLGIAALLQVSPENALPAYQRVLDIQADSPDARGPRVVPVPSQRIDAILSETRFFRRDQILGCRARLFIDGLFLGSRLFVETLYATFRDRFSASRRRAAHRIVPLGPGDFYSFRELRVRPFG